MNVVRTLADLSPALAPLRARGPIALVPTMGALHEGHLSLVRLAREQASSVVVSIFVNPLQFSPGDDFDRYPRPLERDLRLLEGEKTDVAFCPASAELTPAEATISVLVGDVTEGQEGAVRPGHFTGVATIVAKLFNAVRPDVAVFGRKDLQQAAVVRRLIRDLNYPIRLLVAPISREEDGLARSSRNVYLTGEERRAAAAFPRTLEAARKAIADGRHAPSVEEETRRALAASGFGVDYVEVVDPETMKPPRELAGAVIAGAVRVGRVRLLDNFEIGKG
jgi:pantoate--beta-alanine ligase